MFNRIMKSLPIVLAVIWVSSVFVSVAVSFSAQGSNWVIGIGDGIGSVSMISGPGYSPDWGVSPALGEYGIQWFQWNTVGLGGANTSRSWHFPLWFGLAVVAAAEILIRVAALRRGLDPAPVATSTPDKAPKEGAAAEADDDLCPVCGYMLVGLSENRCPECGNAFQPDAKKRSRSDLRRALTKAFLRFTFYVSIVGVLSVAATPVLAGAMSALLLGHQIDAAVIEAYGANLPWPSYLPAALGFIPIIAMTFGLFRNPVVQSSPNERMIRLVAILTVTFTFFAMHAAINAIIRFG